MDIHSGKEQRGRGRTWVVVAVPLCTVDRPDLMDKVSWSRNPRKEYSEEEHGGQRPRQWQRPGGEEWDWRVQKTEQAEPGGCCYLCPLLLLPMAHLAFLRILIQFRSLCCLNFLGPLLSHLKSHMAKLISDFHLPQHHLSPAQPRCCSWTVHQTSRLHPLRLSAHFHAEIFTVWCLGKAALLSVRPMHDQQSPLPSLLVP